MTSDNCRLFCSVLFLFFLQCNSSAHYPTPDSLRGLPRLAIDVYVEDPAPAAQVKDTLQKLLTNANIPYTELKTSDGEAHLHLTVSCTPTVKGDLVGYHAELSIEQNVQLARNTQIKLMATTWRNSYTNLSSQQQLKHTPDLLLVDIRSLVEAFVRDYKKANS